MTHHHFHPRQRTSGFTLVELLVVITIIGIIGTVVTVNVLQYIDTAKRTKAIDMIITLKTACDSYRMHKGEYPASLDKLTEASKKNGNESYVKKLPKDPYGQDFVYKVVSPKEIQLSSKGLDKQEGGDDDITLEKIENGEYNEDE